MRNQPVSNTAFFFPVYSLFWLKILREEYLLDRVRVPSRDLGWVSFSSC